MHPAGGSAPFCGLLTVGGEVASCRALSRSFHTHTHRGAQEIFSRSYNVLSAASHVLISVALGLMRLPTAQPMWIEPALVIWTNVHNATPTTMAMGSCDGTVGIGTPNRSILVAFSWMGFLPRCLLTLVRHFRTQKIHTELILIQKLQ